MQRFKLPAEIPHSLEERMERILKRKEQSRRTAKVGASHSSLELLWFQSSWSTKKAAETSGIYERSFEFD